MPSPDPTLSTPVAPQLTKTYAFRLILSGEIPSIEEAADRLFEAGCDDALFGLSAGTPEVAFARESTSLHDAVSSAIADIRRAGVGLEVVKVENDGE